MGNVDSIDALFYKYCSFNDAIDILRNNKLFFTCPAIFNDPFDSTFWVQNEGTKEEWKQFLYNTDLDIKTVEDVLTNKLQNTEENTYKLSKNIDVGILKYQKEIKKRAQILSLSQINDNILMWSHYASNHEGVCLCFKAELKDEELGFYFDSEFLPLHEVKYKEYFPKPINMLNPDKNEFKSFMDFLTTKYDDWKYENEYRLIVPNMGQKKRLTKQYEKKSLEGIIFGLCTSRDNIRQVYEIIDENYLKKGHDVNFYASTWVEGKYCIKSEKIESIEDYLKSKR